MKRAQVALRRLSRKSLDSCTSVSATTPPLASLWHLATGENFSEHVLSRGAHANPARLRFGAITFDHMRQARRPFRRALRDLPSPRPDAAGRETHHENRAVLIDLDARTMHVANGPPCS